MTTCTISSLSPGTKTLIRLLYQTDSNASVGTVITNTATISSSTTDPRDTDNSATAKLAITSQSTDTTCNLVCPADITVPANTTQNNQRGAVVNFDAQVSGDCGAVTASPASGSFFTVGNTTVNVSSSGGSCSFTVTVTEPPALSISCPAPVTKDAGDDCTAKVTSQDLGTPTTAGGTGAVAIEGDRSDGEDLEAPYPLGRTVNGTDTTKPTIIPPPDVVDTTGAEGASCGKVVSETQMGTPTTDDNCSSAVRVRRTGVPSGNFFPIGETIVTYTATDRAGNTSDPVTQKVTIRDNTPPVLFAPADASYTCRSEVPAGNPSQATGPDIVDQNGVHQPGPPSDNCGVPAVTVSDSSSGAGSARSPLVITRTFTATDGANNTASAVQIITVIDDTPPTIAAPPDVNANTGAGATSCDAVVSDSALGSAQAQDNCGGVFVSRSPSGNTFAIGTTAVIWTATDAAGNTATATQHVTVTDNTAPTITPPADTQVNANTGSCSATGVALGTPVNADNCAVASVTNNAPSSFPLGNTMVTWTVTDTAGNTATATQKVTVVDNQNPTITAPADKTVNADAGSCSASGVALGTPTTADNCSVASVTNNAPGVYPVGQTTVTWTVTDGSGNTATAAQNVTVVDNQNPTITAPADKTLYTGAGATSCDVTVSNLNATLGTATANDNCPGVTWARGGSNVFPLGDTTVIYTATDAHGNTATATQKVTVVDNTPPTVTPPANITVNLPQNSSATSMAVNCPNPATATDNCAGAIGISYSPASGSTFSVGTSTVTVTATDAHGNSAMTTFTVTVLYNFTGFFSPVANLPTLNVVNAGRAIPVKFSLSGNKGLAIFASGSPVSGPVACGTDATVDLEDTVTAGSSSLSYDTGSGQYNYVWKTEGAWAGTCRQLVIQLNDGSFHRANFKFR